MLFYSWWNPTYIFLLLLSILFNFVMGRALGNPVGETYRKFPYLKIFLFVMSISCNLLALVYFKYFNFFIDNINNIFSIDFHFNKIILPLAISFFTFQQITFLVDSYRGVIKEYNFLNYCLFVTFFPQLIAGPIVHHKEMMPQFANERQFEFDFKNLSIGGTILIIGLYKKVILADGMALHVAPIFQAVEQNVVLTFFEAWGGALAYTFQIYFDFSGYSDMAIGLGRMFGIVLPLNFYSPYKANNIIEFWRRWHITLSRFLKNYLYIPLGGNRKGEIRKYINLVITMFLGGLWHGAGWMFAFWGVLHGFYLCVNYGFQTLKRSTAWGLQRTTFFGTLFSRLITFIAVIIGWVFFRADSFCGAKNLMKGMSGLNGFNFSNEMSIEFNIQLLFLLIVVWFMPNTQEIMQNHKPTLKTEILNLSPVQFQWNPTKYIAVIFSIILVYSLISLSNPSEFLYFQF